VGKDGLENDPEFLCKSGVENKPVFVRLWLADFDVDYPFLPGNFLFTGVKPLLLGTFLRESESDLAFLDGGTFQGTKETANLFGYAKLDILISDGRESHVEDFICLWLEGAEETVEED